VEEEFLVLKPGGAVAPWLATLLAGRSRAVPRPLFDRISRTGAGTGTDRQRILWARGATPRVFVASLADVAAPVAFAG